MEFRVWAYICPNPKQFDCSAALLFINSDLARENRIDGFWGETASIIPLLELYPEHDFVPASNNLRDKEIRRSEPKIVLDDIFETPRHGNLCAGHFWKTRCNFLEIRNMVVCAEDICTVVHFKQRSSAPMMLKSCICSLKLAFRVSITHTFSTAATTLYGAQYSIHVCSSTPFLVCKDIHAEFLLASLDEINVRQHALIFKGP
jgi:hypothetical protein